MKSKLEMSGTSPMGKLNWKSRLKNCNLLLLRNKKRKLKMNNQRKRSEHTEVAVDEVVDAVATANLEVNMVSKEADEVAVKDLRQPLSMPKGLSLREKTMNKFTQPQPKLKSTSKSKVISKLLKITTLHYENTQAFKFITIANY